jgi:hypothetical protein
MSPINPDSHTDLARDTDCISGERGVREMLVIAIYTWIWLRFRPSVFVVRLDVIEVAWPLKRRRIPRADIANVRLLER